MIPIPKQSGNKLEFDMIEFVPEYHLTNVVQEREHCGNICKELSGEQVFYPDKGTNWSASELKIIAEYMENMK